MPDDMNTNTGAGAVSTETGAGAVSAESQAQTSQAGQQTTQQSSQQTQAASQTPEKLLGGDGDINKPENYFTPDIDWSDPEKAKKQLAAKIEYGAKIRQSTADKKIAEMQKQAKKYGFNDVNEFRQMLEHNEGGLLDEIQRQKDEEEKLNQVTQKANEYIFWAKENWDKIPETTKTEFLKSLSPEARMTFENAVQLDRNKRAEQSIIAEKLDSENIKKHGESYTKLKPEFAKFVNEKLLKNAPEFVFKAMNYESYGQEMYQKGLKEKNSNPNINLNDISSNGNTPEIKLTPEQVLEQFVKQNGLGG